MDDRLGTVLMNGKVVDLEKLSILELKKIKNEMRLKEKEIKDEIEKIMAK